MNIRNYNDYIVATVNNEVKKQIATLSTQINNTLRNDLGNIVALYSNPSSIENINLINTFFQMISRILLNDLNGFATPYNLTDFRQSLESYVDDRLIQLTNSNDATNNVGSILSQITNEIATLLANNSIFNSYMEQVLVEYLNVRPELQNALSDKIISIINNDPNFISLIIQTVNSRLDNELTTDIQNKLLSIINNLTELILPRFIESIINVKAMINDINILQIMSTDLYGTTTNYQSYYDSLVAKIKGNTIQYTVPIISNNVVLLSQFVSMNEPLDPMINYVFTLDLCISNIGGINNSNYGELATRFIAFVTEINSIFTPIITYPNLPETQNALTLEVLNNIVGLLWNFMRYLKLIKTKLVINRNNPSVQTISSIQSVIYPADNASIDFLFAMVELYIDKIKLDLIEATVYASYTSDGMISYELKQFKGSVSKLL